jgi:hypothetical protein
MSKKLILGVVILIGLVVGVLGTPSAALAAQEPIAVKNNSFAVQSGSDDTTQHLYNVPAGKQLVIEFVTMVCSLPPGQRVYMAISTDQTSFRLVNTYQGTDIWGYGPHYIASQMVRIYATAGQPIKAYVSRDTSSGSVTCAVSFSGYIEDN